MTNRVTVQKFEVMSYIFHAVEICIIGNAQKCATKIWNCVGFDSHSSDYEDFCLLGHDAM
jgi:hypothetical protein